MASVLIREAKEGDCGNILRLIRVRAAGRKPGSQRGSERRCWSGDGKEEVGAEGGARPGLLLREQ